MRFTPYYIYSIIVLVFMATVCKANEADTATTATSHYVHQLILDYRPGAILHTNDFLKGNNPEVRTMTWAIT